MNLNSRIVVPELDGDPQIGEVVVAGCPIIAHKILALPPDNLFQVEAAA